MRVTTSSSIGDKFTITFNKATSRPAGTAAQLFQFSDSVGSLTGAWLNSSIYCATVSDTSGAAVAIGSTTVTPNLGGIGIRDATDTSAVANEVSPPLTGRFGTTKPSTVPVTWTNLRQMVTGGPQ